MLEKRFSLGRDAQERGRENSAPMAIPGEEDRMNSRFLAAAVSAALVVSAFTSCADKQTAQTSAAPQGAEPIPVLVRLVAESSLEVMGEYYGSAEPVAGATLRAPAGGRVDALHVSEGDKVKQGDSLGGVALATAEAQHRTAVLNERIAAESFRRQKDFFASGSAAKVAVDQAELAWNSSRTALLQAEEVLRGARCESPLNGTVLSREIELYDELAPGGATFTVGDLSRVRIEIGIPEADIGGASVGDAAQVTFAAFPGEEFRGKLAGVDRALSPRTLTFKAVVVLENPGERILPGVTAKVVLPRRTVEKAVVVPSEALLNESGGSFVMTAEKRESAWIARKVAVAAGPAAGAGSTVIRKGLSAGDYLIVEGNHLAAEGQPVVFDERLALADGVRGN